MSYNTEQIDIILTEDDFKILKDSNPQYFDMLINAYNAITLVEGWDFLRHFNESFIISSHPMISKITQTMDDLGYSIHSASTFVWTMKHMEYLAKYGKIAYIEILKLLV